MKSWVITLLIGCVVLVPTAVAGEEAAVVSDLKITTLSTMLTEFQGLGEWGFAALVEADQAKALLGEACKAADVKKGVLMKSLRGALMGQLQGPDLMQSWLLLNAAGQDRGRISSALS